MRVDFSPFFSVLILTTILWSISWYMKEFSISRHYILWINGINQASNLRFIICRHWGQTIKLELLLSMVCLTTIHFLWLFGIGVNKIIFPQIILFCQKYVTIWYNWLSWVLKGFLRSHFSPILFLKATILNKSICCIAIDVWSSVVG